MVGYSFYSLLTTMHKAFKISLYIIGGIIVLLLGAVLYLNSPWGQDFVRGRAEAYLRNKLKTEVHIGHLGYGLPKYIVINDALFLDRAKDTMLAVKTLKVDISMMKLLHKDVDIQQIVLKGVHSHIYRNIPDTNYNFSYAADAFASNTPADTTKKTDTSSALTFNIDKVDIEDIHARFDDYTGGMRLALNLDRLNLKMGKTDMKSMLFHIKQLTVDGMQTVFDEDSSYLPPPPKDTTRGRLKVVADNVDLRHIGFRYNSNLNKFLFALQLGGLQLQLNNYNRDSNLVDIKRLAINNSTASLTFEKSAKAPAPIDTIRKIDTTEGWDVRAKDIDLSGLNLVMDNQNVKRLPSGLDYNHLDIRDFALKMQRLFYSTEVEGNINHMAFTEQSGLDLRELKTVFNYSTQGAILRDLYLQTPYTTLQHYIEFHYPSVEYLQKHMQSLELNVNLENSIIGLHDAALFMPELKSQPLFRKYPNGEVRLDAILTGFLNNLNISKFYAKGLDNMEINVNGKIGGLPDANKLNYALHIAKFNASRDDLNALLPPKTIPSSIRVPDRFGIAGQIAGNTKDNSMDLLFGSTDGMAYIKGAVLTSPGTGREKYDLVIATRQLNVGRIMRQDTLMGAITAKVYIKGQSFDIKTMNATASADISSAFIKGYRYHDVDLKGNVAAQRATVDMHSADSNLRVQLNGWADFSGQYAAIKADVKMDSINLHALKLYSGELRMRGRIHADIPELNPDYPRGSVTWWQPVVLVNGKRYFMDSVYALSRPSRDTGQNIFVNLGLLDAHVTGRTPLTKVGAIVQEHIDRHYDPSIKDSLRMDIARVAKKDIRQISETIKQRAVASNQLRKDTTTIPADYNLNLVAHVYDKPMLHSLYPSLTSFDSIHIDGSLNPRQMLFNTNTSEIVYSPYTIENAKFQLKENDSALTYKLNFDQVSMSNYALYYGDVHGAMDRNVITTSVSLSDNEKKERFALNTSLRATGDSQVIQLMPGLKLNYQVWQVSQPNRIVLDSKGFYVQNFEINNQGQDIKANSMQPRSNTPLRIDISNFTLRNLTDIASKNDTLVADGVLGGNVIITQMSPTMKMNADLQIQNLSVYGDTVGNMHALVNNKTDNALDTRITVTGRGNDISLTGLYYLKPYNGNDLDMNAAINALAVKTFEGVAMHQIANSSGYLRGNLRIQGSLSSPSITGDLRTDNLRTTATVLKTDLRMPAEHVTFTGKEVAFNNFTMLDSAGNKAMVNGTVGFEDLANPDLNLTVKADQWRAIHNTQRDNNQLFGTLILSTNVTIVGTATDPSVNGNIHVLNGTKLSVVNPQQNPQIQNTKGVVVFVNMRDSSWGKALMPRAMDSLKPKHKLAAGAEINVNIVVDKNAEFSIIIDEATGDFVNVRGEAYLNTSVSPGGVFEVTGNYLLHSGVYQMNYNFIRRRFEIQDGSSITFAGDPMKNTMLDVNAIYRANTPAYDLVMRQVPDPAQLNYFKQSLPFDVNLHMKGNLELPSITFDIALPENKVYPLAADQIDLVQAKLSQLRQDTSELNKQVFALLILGRFVSDDPFSSAGAQSVGFAAVQSVSTFIGEELNRAANKLVKGVDLTVDMATTQDYTTGDMRQRTDLNVAASKRVLNDRLKLTVGNDFEVEGPQPNNAASAAIPSNLAADYMISADGRYTVRVYRSEYNEGPLEGYVQETGVNFILSVDYNRFKTVFARSRSKRVKGRKKA
jgi:translocation and assembly module TamB